MSRAYHSASSIALGRRCPRAWAYLYIDGMRDEDVPWSEIEAGRAVTSRQRSLALGKAVHAVGEAHYRGEPVRWGTLPAQIYASGIGSIPSPSEAEEIEVERAIGRTPCAAAPAGVALIACGVLWAGFRDLALWTGWSGGWLQVDYKTTSRIGPWSHTPATLRDDLQCCLYSLDLAQRKCERAIASRWLYLETKAVRRSLAVDVTIDIDHALEVIEPAAATARQLDRIVSSSEAEQRTDACYAYGGCPYHRSAGGPCDAQRSIKSFFSQRSKGHMAIDPALLAKFGAGVAPPPAAETPASPFAAPEPATLPASPFAAPEPAVAPPEPAPPAEAPKRTRTRKAAPVVAEAPAFGALPAAAPAASSPVGIVRQLQEALAALQAAETARAEALATIAAIASEQIVSDVESAQ